jgi:hypothetical protein
MNRIKHRNAMEEGITYRRGSQHRLYTSHFSTSLLVNRTDEISWKSFVEVKKLILE